MIPPSNWQLRMLFQIGPSEIVISKTIESLLLNSKLVIELRVAVKSISIVNQVAVESENLLVWSKYLMLGAVIEP